MVGRGIDRSEGREQLSRRLTRVDTVTPLIDSPAQKGSVIAIIYLDSVLDTRVASPLALAFCFLSSACRLNIYNTISDREGIGTSPPPNPLVSYLILYVANNYFLKKNRKG